MKILYVNVIEQNAPWGAETFINRGFNENGVETVCLDFRKNRSHLSEKLRTIGDFDYFFLQRGDYFPLPLVDAVNRPRIFWASELVSRCHDHDHLLKSGLFEHIFVHSVACRSTLINRGWIGPERISVLLNGFDPQLHRKKEGLKKDIPVLFVGNPMPRREALLDRLEEKVSVLRTKAFGEDMVDLFNRAKIVLNLHSDRFPDTETRVFEALGCGSFLLTEPLSEESPFNVGLHLETGKSAEELIDKISYYLNHDKEREEIAEAGYQFVLENHTYGHRAKEIENVFLKSQQIVPVSEPIDFEKLNRFSPIEKRLERNRVIVIFVKKPVLFVKKYIKKIIKRIF